MNTEASERLRPPPEASPSKLQKGPGGSKKRGIGAEEPSGSASLASDPVTTRITGSGPFPSPARLGDFAHPGGSAVGPYGQPVVALDVNQAARDLLAGNADLIRFLDIQRSAPETRLIVNEQEVKGIVSTLQDQTSNIQQKAQELARKLAYERQVRDYILRLLRDYQAQQARDQKAVVATGIEAQNALSRAAASADVALRADADAQRLTEELALEKEAGRKRAQELAQLKVELNGFRRDVTTALRENLKFSDADFKPDIVIDEQANLVSYIRQIGEFQQREYDETKTDLGAAEEALAQQRSLVAGLEADLERARGETKRAKEAAAEAQRQLSEVKAQLAAEERKTKVAIEDKDAAIIDAKRLTENIANLSQQLDEALKQDSGKATEGRIPRLQQQLLEAEKKRQAEKTKYQQEATKLRAEKRAAENAKAEAEHQAEIAKLTAQGDRERLTLSEQKVADAQRLADSFAAELLELRAKLRASGEPIRVPGPAGPGGIPLLEAPGARWVTVWDQAFAAAQLAREADETKLKALIVAARAQAPDAKIAQPNFVLVADAVDAAPRKPDAKEPADAKTLIKADDPMAVAMRMDWEPDDSRRQVVPYVNYAAHQAIVALRDGTSGDFGLEVPQPKRFTYVEDVLDIDAMCQDRAWALAIIDLMRYSAPGAKTTTLYNPLAPLNVQLEEIYNRAHNGSTELLFVLELLLVFNIMKEIRPPGRVEHLEKLIRNFARPGPGPSHVYRIARKVADRLEDIFDAAQRTQDSNELFWWTTSPLKNFILDLYTDSGRFNGNKAYLVEHGFELRKMFAGSPYTYHILWASLMRNQTFVFVFQDLCGVLWDANNFRANFDKVLNQPGGALLIDIFMNAANTPIYQKHFGLPFVEGKQSPGWVTRAQVYRVLNNHISRTFRIDGDKVMNDISVSLNRLADSYAPPPGLEGPPAPRLLQQPPALVAGFQV